MHTYLKYKCNISVIYISHTGISLYYQPFAYL